MARDTASPETVGYLPSTNRGTRFDGASLVFAILGGVGFFALAWISLSLSKFDTILANIWLPNAVAVASLLRARREVLPPFLVSAFTGSVFANLYIGNALEMSLIFSIANIFEITLITWLVRRESCGSTNMSDLEDLTRFIWFGGVVGPFASACIAAFAMGPDGQTMWAGASAWFLTDSMGMILIVPTVLLVIDNWRSGRRAAFMRLGYQSALLVGGTACTYLVFKQDIYPLLFLVMPITLLHAFRTGSLGTAISIIAVAIVTSAMTWADIGPIAKAATSPSNELHLVQAFIVANFLTGLPVAAILAGRERIKDELKEGKRQLDMLANNITDAVLRYNVDGVCTYASPSVAEVLGEDPATFVGNMPTDRMHEDARKQIATAQERLLTGESDKERFTYRRYLDDADGKPVYIEADCALALNSETGEREGIVVSARDVTERVELELLLTRARRHAENAARAKSEFLANMSHEIRTPMNGVLGFAELMLQGDLNEDQRRQTDLIVQSGRSMMLLLNDILDLSKIEAGQITIDQTPVDLHETLAECAALHRPNAHKKGLELFFGQRGDDKAGSDTAHTWVTTDGLRVRQIVLNLIGNAVKFTEKGHVSVEYEIDGGQFCVRVSDTGIGISQARLENVFKPFTQAESDTTRRFGGTGLGLTISNQLAELLGGFIEVESEPGVGSCFTLKLPAVPAVPQATAPTQKEAVPLDTLPHDARILLAEDHDINRILASEMLKKCGQSVAIAYDGNEAISMVIDSIVRGVPYDLVLMDIQMPGCDGYAATRAIRAEGIRGDELPIIALTANAFPEDIAAARDAGMQGHLAKPLVFADLARVLQRWLPTRIVENEEISPAVHLEDEDKRAQLRLEDTASGEPASGNASGVLQMHSPELIERWLIRRTQAVDAVRDALSSGAFTDAPKSGAEHEALIRVVHKLAGTAAMFGEGELGTQASLLERALRGEQDPQKQLELAAELVLLADAYETPGEHLLSA